MLQVISRAIPGDFLELSEGFPKDFAATVKEKLINFS